MLTQWQVDGHKKTVSGTGLLYDARRKVVGRGRLEVGFADILLLETNRPEAVTKVSAGAIVVFGVLTAGTVVLAAVCAANPKACWGSCPTFYAYDGHGLALQAEGFSWSVARALEATDVDALFTARPRTRHVRLTMTNESLETHAVRSLRLIAVPRPAGARVFRAGSRYFPARRLTPPRTCRSEQGDCRADVRAIDHREYRSPADSKDLAAREVLHLTFPRPTGRRLGLVVGARNTLLNTFLFYQLLAYMGPRAAEWFMKLERGGDRYTDTVRAIGRTLGDVDISVYTRRGWRRAGAFAETGPIAKEVQLVRLPADLPPGAVRIRVTLTRGNWKLDYLALAELDAAVTPRALVPERLDHQGRQAPAALRRLRDPRLHLMTYPRDRYTIHFTLPGDPAGYELFLESRGYYYEWIRKAWLGEENAERLVEFLRDPRRALRRLAPAYKRAEPHMESIFWKSRIGVWP